MFGAVTVTTKLSLALKAPSLTVTVIVLVPVCPAAGVTLTVRLAPLPPKTIPLSGTSAGLLEVPLTVKLPTAVSMSPTVNPIAPVPVFTGMDRSAISPIVGAAGPPPTVVRVRLQLVMFPESPGPSSITYNDHAPAAAYPLNAARIAA